MSKQINKQTSKRKRIITSVIIAAIVLAIGIGAFIVIKQNAKRDSQTLQAGQSAHMLNIDGRERQYRLYVPPSASASDKLPLVVVLHGALGTGEQAEESYGWNKKADSDKFAVAYPDGLKRSWAVSERCCGPPARDGVNDVAFIEQMVGDISKQISVDNKRVYAAGISNGGALAYRLACDTDTFAAIGVVAATLLGDCPSPSKVSVMHIHGTADQTFPYDGGPGRRNNDGQGDRPADTSGPGIPQLISKWRSIDQCQESVKSFSENGVTTDTAACMDGRTVTLVTIQGAGHQWPGSTMTNERAVKLLNLDPPSTAINATDILWDFFRQQSQP